MSIRTIEAPGVQINEIDKSDYTPSMTGTRCYVMGYANKGEPYQPMEFTSIASLQNYYGEPDNEAERYFYNACSEVINQNGVLYSARIPYDNASKEKMIGFKYTVANNTMHIPSAGEYLTKDGGMKAWVDHDSDFEKDALSYVIQNNCCREIDGNLYNGLEQDTEIKQFYNAVIKRFNATYNEKINYKRWSVDYYKTNEEKSSALSARFLTRQQAEEYMDNLKAQSVKNLYIYHTDYEGSILSSGSYDHGILSDMGDWVALPLYCEYNKEAVICAIYTVGPEISTVGDMRDKTFDLISSSGNLSLDIGDGRKIKTVEDISSIEILSTSYVALHTKLSAGSDEYKTLTDLSIGLSVAHNDESGQGGPRHEINSLAYASWRKNVLNDKTNTTSVYFNELYDDKADIVNRTSIAVVPAYVSAEYHCDGANNEFIYETVVSALYEDPILSKSELKPNETCISSYIVDEDGVVVKNAYAELWEPYKKRTLKDILTENSKKDSKHVFQTFETILNAYKMSGEISYQTIIEKYGAENGDYKERINVEVPYYEIIDADKTMDEYLKIIPSKAPISADLSAVDELRTGENMTGANTFYIFDKTCGTLNRIMEDSRKDLNREMIGIFPVITTAANAIYAQSLIKVDDSNVIKYENVTGAITKTKDPLDSKLSSVNTLLSSDISLRFSQNDRKEDEGVIDTVSRDANNYFLPISMNPNMDGFDTENTKKIGVVIYKAFLDPSEGNKVSFQVVESFVGSLDRKAKDSNTGVSQFLDTIINTQSEYIYFFSNCFVNTVTKQQLEKADFFLCEKGNTGMLGWYSNETQETIALNGIYQGMDKCLKYVEDINERDIDIIPDAGLANIAQYMKSVYSGVGSHAYDLNATNKLGQPLIKAWKCSSAADVEAWKTVEMKLDNFCKNVRKDCMFIADGPRPMVLNGNVKIVRPSKPSNTIDANILPYVKYATGLNTNYGAGYLDWFKITDEFTGDTFWCPPSIKAMGVYINTDLNFEYWDAPAGLNRGIIQALDCAFSPTIKQAGSIYQKNWNYAINYPYDGIVLEGQKTFQVKPSAFDRVNVRRLFLRLERQSYKVARYFVYEGNTAYTRQRLIDMLNPLFYQAKVGGGIYDYLIVCDESINTPTVIDNNELRVKIGIKPVKTAEFIMIDFIALPTGGSFSEM